MLVGLAMVGRWLVVLLEGLGVLVEVDMLELVVELEGEPYLVLKSLIRLLALFVYIMDKTGTAVNKVKTLLKYFVRLTFP